MEDSEYKWMGRASMFQSVICEQRLSLCKWGFCLFFSCHYLAKVRKGGRQEKIKNKGGRQKHKSKLLMSKLSDSRVLQFSKSTFTHRRGDRGNVWCSAKTIILQYFWKRKEMIPFFWVMCHGFLNLMQTNKNYKKLYSEC